MSGFDTPNDAPQKDLLSHASGSNSAVMPGYVLKCSWARKRITGVNKKLIGVGCTPRVLPPWCLDDFKFCPYCGKEIDKST